MASRDWVRGYAHEDPEVYVPPRHIFDRDRPYTSDAALPNPNPDLDLDLREVRPMACRS